MAKKDCMNCKNCILRPMAYQEGVTNTCKFQSRLDNMSKEVLLQRILFNECELFEEGMPEKSDEVCYDD